jgi:cyclophilin family peptidyl-prolyl cis-trans isomerase
MKRILFFILLMGLLSACSPSKYKSSWTRQQAPAQFTALFQTTEGDFTIEAKREWSPKGVDRLYQLIRHGYFTEVPIYRVVPGFIAQFGHLDSAKISQWNKVKILDEPVSESNKSATISFARAGKDTRNTQCYINLADNPKLDTSGQTRGIKGFPVIAKVVAGMDVVLKFFPYQDEPRRRLPRRTEAKPFFEEKYPKMAYIQKAILVKQPRK